MSGGAGSICFFDAGVFPMTEVSSMYFKPRALAEIKLRILAWLRFWLSASISLTS